MAMTSECFIDRVIDDFVHKVVKTAHTGITDVHAWTFANRLESFEDLNRIGAIILLVTILLTVWSDRTV